MFIKYINLFYFQTLNLWKIFQCVWLEIIRIVIELGLKTNIRKYLWVWKFKTDINFVGKPLRIWNETDLKSWNKKAIKKLHWKWRQPSRLKTLRNYSTFANRIYPQLIN